MRYPRKLLLSFILILPVILSLAFSSAALAGEPAQDDLPEPDSQSIADETCLTCHGIPGLTMPLENGEELDLFVNPLEHQASIHGELGYACVQCHIEVGDYPHPEFSAADHRDVSLQMVDLCQRCHTGEYEMSQDSTHARVLAEGVREGAICTDCHTAHEVRQLTDMETGELTPEAHLWIPKTCQMCHSTIHEKYEESVHGKALIEGNPDVPTCIDCHGVHSMEDPRTTEFRLNSPEICAECHTNASIMDKYGISTNVLDTYVADFHGTTITLFEQQSPDAESNKPVCFDCHGVHDIMAVDDPQKGLSVKKNLMVRCQACHPDATANFPDSWLAHYEPSREKFPIVYYVDLFYKILIPTVLGGMGLLVVLDFGRMTTNKLKLRKKDLPAVQKAEKKEEGSNEQ